MASYLWRKYADYVYTKWERMILWNMVEPYGRPKSFTPLVTIYVAAFYTGVIGSAITEQLYKFQKLKDAIALHNTARCSIGRPKGVGDLRDLILEPSSAPKDKPSESASS